MMEKSKSESKSKEVLSLGGDIGLAIFSMKEIAKGEEGAMEAAAYFTKVFSAKRTRTQAVKDISYFVIRRFTEKNEEAVRWYAAFLNRCLGYNTKRILREEFKKTNPECLAVLVEYGFRDISNLT